MASDPRTSAPESGVDSGDTHLDSGDVTPSGSGGTTRPGPAEATTPAPRVDGAATFVAGIELVRSDVIAALRRVGIEPYSPEGQPFDPQYHEAVAQQPVEGTAPGTVVEVFQLGYRMGEHVLRPARVVVAG